MVRCRGFTLVELLVVVGIIIILSATLMPKFLSYTDRAREARAVSDLSTIKSILEIYAADEGGGEYPENSYNLKSSKSVASVMKEHGVEWGNDEGILDPWGNPYMYIRID